MDKKVLMLATTAAMIEQFNKNNILILEEMGYEVHVIGNWKEGNPISEERLSLFRVWLEEHHGKWFHMDSTRKPYDLKNNISAYRKVVELIQIHHYRFIHCHTPIGSVIARMAAHRTKTPIIYTAHGFHFYTGAPLVNWLIYYPVEKLLSYWTDVLITINQEDYNRAKKKFHAKKVEYVPGVGVDVEKFLSPLPDREERRVELGISSKDIMLFSVGELNKNKNHSLVIRAMGEMKNSSVHYVIAGKGELYQYLLDLAKDYGIADRVHLLGFRTDVCELYKMADIFVFPSLREGLSVSLMEAMASGLPCAVSRIRGNVDLIDENEGCCFFEIQNDKDIYNTFMKLILSDTERMGIYNRQGVKKFSLENVWKKTEEIYKDIL